MRNDEQRKVLRRCTLRQRQVGRDLEAVGRWIVDGDHGREPVAIELLPAAILQRELFCLAIEQIDGSGIDVRAGDDDVESLVARRRLIADLLARQLLPEQPVVRLKCFVFPHDSLFVVDIDRGNQIVRCLGEHRVVEIDAVLGIRLDQLLVPRLDVEQREADEVDALVRLKIHAPSVLVETDRSARLEHGAGVDF